MAKYTCDFKHKIYCQYIYIYIYIYIAKHGQAVYFTFSIFNVLRILETLEIFFNKSLLKWGKNEKDFEPSILFEAQNYFVFESKLNFFFKWSYSQSCFNVAQRCEN